VRLGHLGAVWSTKPRITPTGSLSRSHRETWTTSGAVAGGGGAGSAARRITIPIVPSVRTNPGTAVSLSQPDTSPAVVRIARTVFGASCWFFGEKASMDGGMITIRVGSSPGGAYSRRVNT